METLVKCGATALITLAMMLSGLGGAKIDAGTTDAQGTPEQTVQDIYAVDTETFMPAKLHTEIVVETYDLNRRLEFTGSVYSNEYTGNLIANPEGEDNFEIQVVDDTLQIYDENYQLVAISHDYSVNY